MGNSFISDFKAKHPEEIGANGVIKVCIGGGAGFIGSHIAKRLMAEVKDQHICTSKRIISPVSVSLKLHPHFCRAAMSCAQTGKRTSSWNNPSSATNSTKSISEFWRTVSRSQPDVNMSTVLLLIWVAWDSSSPTSLCCFTTTP